MTTTTHIHKLTGCTPVPLAGYLKGLGILRLVAEQIDPTALGWWSGDVFHLETTLDKETLLSFFREKYEPTPLVGPWGARSGFFPAASEKSAREALVEIETSDLPRLQRFGEAVEAVRGVLSRIKLTQKAESPEEKRRLMMQCRSSLPDAIVTWLDATYMLLDTETRYPPLLGTGGNEGSGSYMSGFAQQVASVVIRREWDHALSASLFATPSNHLYSTQTPGHFSPEAVGGPNASSASEGKVSTNPWDYLLLLEGTLLFASASVRRMEQKVGGALSYPFCVRQTGAGYGSAATDDEAKSRAEMWLPLWSQRSSREELTALFSEGRSQIGTRPSRNGVDFARSLVTLGVDRGITEFHRYAFQERNGQNNFAIPLGRFKVHTQPQVNLLGGALDRWIDIFRSAAASDAAPARAKRVLKTLDEAVIQLTQSNRSDQLQAVLIALGKAQSTFASCPGMREESYRRPIPLLPSDWLTECDDGSEEFRLAASLAAIDSPVVGRIRQHLEPVVVKKYGPEWDDSSATASRIVWCDTSLDRNLIAVFKRRCIDAEMLNERVDGHNLAFPGHSCCSASIGDIARFLNGRTDDTKIVELLHGLMLLDWTSIRESFKSWRFKNVPESLEYPDASYSLLKLCYFPMKISGVDVKMDPAIYRLASSDNLEAGALLSIERLRASGFCPLMKNVARTGQVSRRICASLLFPISVRSMEILADRVVKCPPS